MLRALILTLCLLAPAAAVAQTCTLPAKGIEPSVRPRHEERVARRLKAADEELGKEKADLMLLGDSISQRWPQESLEEAFPDLRVLNLGVRGDRIDDLLFRLGGLTTETDSGAVGLTNWAKQSPKRVVILIGTNDLRAREPCEIFSGVLQVTEQVRSIYPSAAIEVMSLLPRGGDGKTHEASLARINENLAASAEAHRYRFLDVRAQLKCGGGEAEKCERLFMQPNFVHPTDDGYARIVEALKALR
jgi:lysophospholipase L1-like esterase